MHSYLMRRTGAFQPNPSLLLFKGLKLHKIQLLLEITPLSLFSLNEKNVCRFIPKWVYLAGYNSIGYVVWNKSTQICSSFVKVRKLWKSVTPKMNEERKNTN